MNVYAFLKKDVSEVSLLLSETPFGKRHCKINKNLRNYKISPLSRSLNRPSGLPGPFPTKQIQIRFANLKK